MARKASAIAAYWRQVHAVQALTGASSAAARRAVTVLRSERGYTTAAETKRHPIIVGKAAAHAERTIAREQRVDFDREPPAKPKPYRDLGDWIDTWNGWEGDYDEIDVETNADY